jgi:hypothetical protein
MKKNKVLETYKHDFSDPETVGIGIEEIEFIANNDPVEFQNLIELFESENRLTFKIILSKILASLNYVPIKNFYLALINDDENKLETEEYDSDWSHTGNKIVAAAMLLSMNDTRGKEFFKKLVKTADSKHLDWIVLELYEETYPQKSSIMGLECLLQLADDYESIASRIDREKVEDLLRRIRAGEKVALEPPFW